MEMRRVWFHGHPIFEQSEYFQQPTSLSQVGPSHPASRGHAGGKLLASIDHVRENSHPLLVMLTPLKKMVV